MGKDKWEKQVEFEKVNSREVEKVNNVYQLKLSLQEIDHIQIFR